MNMISKYTGEGVYQRATVGCGLKHKLASQPEQVSRGSVWSSFTANLPVFRKSLVMVTEVKVEDWSGKTGVKMVTLTSPKLQVNLVKIRNDRWKVFFPQKLAKIGQTLVECRFAFSPLEQQCTLWYTLGRGQKRTEMWSWALTRWTTSSCPSTSTPSSSCPSSPNFDPVHPCHIQPIQLRLKFRSVSKGVRLRRQG